MEATMTKDGLFIPKELLARINIEEDIEMEIKDKEIWIHPVEKKKGVVKNAAEIWQSVEGHWKKHPVFGNMKTKEIIEWLRGSDSDV